MKIKTMKSKKDRQQNSVTENKLFVCMCFPSESAQEPGRQGSSSYKTHKPQFYIHF